MHNPGPPEVLTEQGRTRVAGAPLRIECLRPDRKCERKATCDVPSDDGLDGMQYQLVFLRAGGARKLSAEEAKAYAGWLDLQYTHGRWHWGAPDDAVEAACDPRRPPVPRGTCPLGRLCAASFWDL